MSKDIWWLVSLVKKKFLYAAYCIYKCISIDFQQTLRQWNKVFYLSGGICISSGLIYLFYGTSKVQKWNSYEDPKSNEKEMKLFNDKSESVNVPKK